MYLTLIVLLIWAVGACFRIYQQARFYQIEEYMSLRYLRWLFTDRRQWLPARGVAAGIGGTVAALFTGDTDLVTFGLLAVAAVVGVYPREPREVKKAFQRTKRATRLLGASFAVALLLSVLAFMLVLPIGDSELQLVAAHLFGFLVWMLAPVLLTVGNVLMVPVEANIREGFKRQARMRLAEVNPTVIGITGSYGKTSTKTYLAHLLNGKYQAFPTPKSWNTIMGVCLAINTRMDDRTDYFICEMGAYVEGEIQEISAMTEPTISIVTEVGPQHLERFGSLENISRAKYEIIKALPSDGVGVFNWDNPYVREMYERGYPGTRLAISRDTDPSMLFDGDGARFVASDETETLDGISFTVTDRATGEQERFETLLVGSHNVTNILLATAVSVHAGMTLAEIAGRARIMAPAEARLVRNVLPNGMTIINDAYSANPVGAVNSLRVLGLHTEGRRLLITPGMVELGPLHATENEKLGVEAAKHATDVILVGADQTAPVRAGLEKAGFPAERLQVLDTVTEAIEWYQRELGSGDTVLFLNDLPDTY